MYLHQTTSIILNLSLWAVSAIVLPLYILAGAAAAQNSPNVTGSGLNTTVTHNGNVYTISGGTRPGDGTNVYHSFGDFSLTAVETARFLNTTPHLSTENLLGRVTGGNPSNIFGTIDTLAFPGANLFLMNPAGIVFGPTAQLNVGGSVIFTTANYLRLDDGALFHSVPNIARDMLLSTAPVATFGFLESPPRPISIRGSSLSVPNEHSIVLAGGSVDIQGDLRGDTLHPAKLYAPNGTIKIASVASPSEVDYPNVTSVTNIDNPSLSDHTTVVLGPNSTIDFRRDNTGQIAIRGGQLALEIRGSLLESRMSGTQTNPTNRVVLNTGSSIVASGSSDSRSINISTDELVLKNGASIISLNDFANGGLISIHATNRVLITGTSSDELAAPSSLQSITFGEGTGSSIRVTTESAGLETNGRIQTDALGSEGKAGNITVDLGTTGHLTVMSGGLLATYGNDSAQSGNIKIYARSIEISNHQLAPDEGGIQNSNAGAAGTGTIAIETDTLRMSNGARVVNESSGNTKDNTNDNKIFVKATGAIELDNDSAIRVRNFSSDVGPLKLSAQSLSLSEQSIISASTFSAGSGGTIEIDANKVTLSGGSRLTTSSSQGIGNAGEIILKNIGTLLLTGNGIDSRGQILPSGIFSSITPAGSNPNAIGRGGTIDISANAVTVTNTARIDTSTNRFALGRGGDILITANQSLSVHDGGAISTSTSGSGDAGDILIKADTVSVTGGATISAESTGTGDAGTVTIQGLHSPANSFLLEGFGSSILTSTKTTGEGGSILINAKDIWLRDGGKVSADTSGRTTSATGGTITIQGDRLRIENGALVTSSSSGAAQGGSIALKASQSVSIHNGATISANSKGPGNAGDIFINAGQRFDLQNSSVTTSASQATGGNIEVQAVDLIRMVNGQISTSVLGGSGNGGNISIDPNMVILQNSQIVAKAVAGAGGNISITTPLFLADQSSLVDASSQFGLNGTVTIQSPTSNLSGTIGQLSPKPSPMHLLVQNRCSALADGQQSTFILNGRQTFPTTPGGWTPSPIIPLAMETLGPNEPRVPSVNRGNMVLSSLPPAKFLGQSLALEESNGCRF